MQYIAIFIAESLLSSLARDIPPKALDLSDIAFDNLEGFLTTENKFIFVSSVHIFIRKRNLRK